jgi:hypothetical protein
VARATAVKLESGVLIVETTSAQWTAEIRRSSPMIVERLRSLLDDQTIERIDVREIPHA